MLNAQKDIIQDVEPSSLHLTLITRPVQKRDTKGEYPDNALCEMEFAVVSNHQGSN
jgi:hypothetical protein